MNKKENTELTKEELSDQMEKAFDRIQELLEQAKKEYLNIPHKYRHEIETNYSDSNPRKSMNVLERDVDYWKANIDSLIDELAD